MKVAHKIGLVLSFTHGVLIYAALGRQFNFMLEVLFASVYLPLIPFAYMGLPVTDGFTGWGWSGPSFLGYVIVIAFWLGVWFLVGHFIECVMNLARNA
jgi:hypothetical protein